MSWPKPLPSVRQQWYQETYAAVPNGNWSGQGQAVLVLNDGRVYLVVRDWMAQQFGLMDAASQVIYKVSPDGNERITPDLRIWGVNNDNVGNTSYPYELPGWSGSGDIRQTPWTDFAGGWYVTDGVSIFVYHQDGGQWFLLNPDTYRIEHIAGVNQYVGQASISVDAYLGADAVIGGGLWKSQPEIQAVTYHDGYIYWLEHVGSGSTNYFSCILRRMKTSYPYSVTTVFDRFKNPVGAPSSSRLDWMASINSATGLPYLCNDDVIQGIASMAFHGEYLYFYDVRYYPVWNFASVGEFARINMETGIKESLVYAWDNGVPFSSQRDMRLDYAATPNGMPLSTNSSLEDLYDPRTGTPDLERMVSWYANAVVVGDSFITAASPFAATYFNYNANGASIIEWNIPEILELFAANNNVPLRHKRSKPYYNTIASGTAGDESFMIVNEKNRLRAWLSRDGYAPIFTHVLEHCGLAANDQAFPNRVFFATPVVPLASRGYNENANLMMVKTLSPGVAGGFRLRVRFEGMQLKGYAAVGDIVREAQDIIEMS